MNNDKRKTKNDERSLFSAAHGLWKMALRLVLCASLCVLYAAAPAFAQNRRLEAKLEEQRVFPGNPVYLNVIFFGEQEDVEKPDIPQMDGLQIKYVGPSSRISVVNGKVTQSISHNFLIIPLKEGVYEIGPFKADVRGEMFVAAPVTLIVSSGGQPSSARASRSGSSPQPSAPVPSGPDTSNRRSYESDRIFLTMDVPKNRVYVGEIMPLTIKLLGTGVSIKDIEYPTYQHDGFSAGDFPEPDKGREMFRGMDYNTLVFSQDIAAVNEGDYTLGPAKLNCTMLVRREAPRRSSGFGRSIFDDDFFSSSLRGYQEYPIQLSSEALKITVLPLPIEGRPEDFLGAVGDFSFDVKADGNKVKLGDPVTFRMTIGGRGNLDTVAAPEIQESLDLKVYKPQVSKKGNTKIYEQVVIPKSEGMKEISGVSFSFFDPKTGRYKTLTRGPFTIEVLPRPAGEGPAKMISAPTPDLMGQVTYQDEKLGRDLIFIKEGPARLVPSGKSVYNGWPFWLFQLFPLSVLILAYLTHREKEKIRLDKKYARFTRAPRKATRGINRAKALIGKKDPLGFYDAVYRTLQGYIGDKFNLSKGAVTGQVIEDVLKPAGYSDAQMADLKHVFEACEMARYASLIPDAQKESEVLNSLRKAIDILERGKGKRG